MRPTYGTFGSSSVQNVNVIFRQYGTLRETDLPSLEVSRLSLTSVERGLGIELASRKTNNKTTSYIDP